MKIRNGFVSNSSSSSFIATYGRVVDVEKFEKWKSTCPHAGKYKIMNGVSLREMQENGGWNQPITSGFFDCMISESDVMQAIKENPDTLFIYKTGVGPDCDSDFMESEDDWDLNYDIDLDRFNADDIELYGSSAEYNGVEVISQTFYAGRNG